MILTTEIKSLNKLLMSKSRLINSYFWRNMRLMLISLKLLTI